MATLIDQATGEVECRCPKGHVTTVTPASWDARTQVGYYGSSFDFCDRCGDAIYHERDAEGGALQPAPKRLASVKHARQSRRTIEETARVGYDGCYYLIVPDHAAGKRKRFTVYRIPSSPSRRIKVVGRELPLGHARRIAEGTV